MEYTEFGNTDITISKLCVGCMSFDGRLLAEVKSCLDKFFATMTNQDKQGFIRGLKKCECD